MENTAFWCGIGAGMVLGAAVGMAVSPRQRSMKTCVGRTMQHMGNAVDNAWEDFLHAIEYSGVTRAARAKPKNKAICLWQMALFLVEAAGVEPASESA